MSTTAAGPDDLGDIGAAIGRLARARVLVVGDAMLDRYIFGRVLRMSPEAPVPVLAMASEHDEPGGAGNVVHNLCALGAATAFVSVVGDDAAGAELTGLIGSQPGVEPWLLVQGGRVTTVKTRFVAEGSRQGGQQLLRTDREDTRPVHPKLAERLVRIARDAMAATSVVVLSDYRKGVLAGDVPAQLIAAAHAAGRRVVVDMRAGDFARYAGADVLVPHRNDLADHADGPPEGDEAIAAAAQAVRVAHRIGAVLVKRGEEGLSLVDAAGAAHFRLDPARLVDLSGAGDAAVATLAAGLAAGLPVRLAAMLANAAAGAAGAQPGTCVVRAEDLHRAVLG
jgi:D-beta-D-heptose 7-phosphate kinase / D-beta-D-heptose 1-phosphate adenosyltransferase